VHDPSSVVALGAVYAVSLGYYKLVFSVSRHRHAIEPGRWEKGPAPVNSGAGLRLSESGGSQDTGAFSGTRPEKPGPVVPAA